MLNNNNLINLVKVDLHDLTNTKFDLGIFCSGYERRSSYYCDLLPRNQFEKIVILGFSSYQDHPTRQKNDSVFMDKYGESPMIVPAGDNIFVPANISHVINFKGHDTFKIFVDYSSMSRNWYSQLLFLFKYLAIEKNKELEVYFAYTGGMWAHTSVHRTINSIYAIPGCEGVPITTRPTLALLGLGYDSLATFAVLDKLEPSSVIAFYAEDPLTPDSPERVLNENKMLCESIDIEMINLDYLNVENAFRVLSEIVHYYISEEWSINLIPLGPKTHTLACILLSQRYPEISCLYVDGKTSVPLDIESSGDGCIFKIENHKTEALIDQMN